MPAHKCEICGEEANLELTEIVTPRHAVVTRHFCKTHWPGDSDLVFKAKLDSSMTELKQMLRDLEEKIYRDLEEGHDRNL